MTRDSGGGGSNKSTRAMPVDTPIGYQGVGGDIGQQIENIDGAFDRQERERRDVIDEQVRRAGDQAYVNKVGSSAFARRQAEGQGRAHAVSDKEGLADHLADAIIGAILIGRLGRNTLTPPGHDERTPAGFRAYDGDAPKGDVFKLDPNAKPVPVTRFLSNGKPAPFYHGSADRMERQAKKVIDQTEIIPGDG